MAQFLMMACPGPPVSELQRPTRAAEGVWRNEQPYSDAEGPSVIARFRLRTIFMRISAEAKRMKTSRRDKMSFTACAAHRLQGRGSSLPQKVASSHEEIICMDSDPHADMLGVPRPIRHKSFDRKAGVLYAGAVHYFVALDTSVEW